MNGRRADPLARGFQAASSAPIFEPLRRLLELTTGVPTTLEEALAGVDGIRAAVIHGSYARGSMRSDSDIDVLVVTEGDRRAASRAVRSAGRRLGREVDATVMTLDGFRDLIAIGNPFLSKITEGDHLPIVGNLEALANRHVPG